MYPVLRLNNTSINMINEFIYFLIPATNERKIIYFSLVAQTGKKIQDFIYFSKIQNKIQDFIVVESSVLKTSGPI